MLDARAKLRDVESGVALSRAEWHHRAKHRGGAIVDDEAFAIDLFKTEASCLASLQWTHEGVVWLFKLRS